MKVTIEFEAGEELTEQGLRFYAMRDNQTVEQFCKDAILCMLEGCEDQPNDYFSSLREEQNKSRRETVAA